MKGRLFKVMKNGIFLFLTSFFFSQIFEFLCYANVPIEDVINASTEKIDHKTKKIYIQCKGVVIFILVTS